MLDIHILARHEPIQEGPFEGDADEWHKIWVSWADFKTPYYRTTHLRMIYLSSPSARDGPQMHVGRISQRVSVMTAIISRTMALRHLRRSNPS